MQSGLCFSIFAENRKDYQVGFPGLQQRSISARGIKVGKVVSSSNSSVVEECGVLVMLLEKGREGLQMWGRISKSTLRACLTIWWNNSPLRDSGKLMVEERW